MTPTTPPVLRALVWASPGLVLAAAGLLHPHHLDHATSGRWTVLHLAGLLVFPLVGVALAGLVRGRRDPLAVLVVATAYLYATAYTALDVISGVGAGYVTWRLGPEVPRPDEVRFLFAVGGQVGEVGSWALIACAALLTVDALRRLRLAGLGGLLLVPGAVLVHVDHIFAPLGASGMALVGLGTGLVVLGGGLSAPRPAPTARHRSRGSRGGRG